MGFKALLMPSATIADVTPPVPVAGFTWLNDYPTSVLTVDFTDTSTNMPTSWLWDFGDGVGTSTAQNPTYAYATAGHYDVTLTATNATGSDGDTQTVPVNALEAELQANSFSRIYQLRQTSGTTAVCTGTDGASGNAIIYSSPVLGVADATGNPDAFDFSDTTMQLEFPAVFLTNDDFTILWYLRGVGNVPTANDLFNGVGNIDILNVNINAVSGALAVTLDTEFGQAALVTDTGTYDADTNYLIAVRYAALTGQLDTRYSTDGTLVSPTLTTDTQVLPSSAPDQLTIVYSNPANTGTVTRLGVLAFTQTRLSDAALLGIAQSIWP